MKCEDIILTPDMILNWDFKIDARGYRPQEVDKLLDKVISDYYAFNNKIKKLEVQIGEMSSEILDLKYKLRTANANMDIIKNSEKEITNVDLLRRISQLEKIIYGDKYGDKN